jgi:hypothetical protein
MTLIDALRIPPISSTAPPRICNSNGQYRKMLSIVNFSDLLELSKLARDGAEIFKWIMTKAHVGMLSAALFCRRHV